MACGGDQKSQGQGWCEGCPDVTCQRLHWIMATSHTPQNGTACSCKVTICLPPDWLCLSLPVAPGEHLPHNCISPWAHLPWVLSLLAPCLTGPSSGHHLSWNFSPLHWCLCHSASFFPSNSISVVLSCSVSAFVPLSVSPYRLPVSRMSFCLVFLSRCFVSWFLLALA